MTSKNGLPVLLLLAAPLLWMGCSGDDPVSQRSCRTDQDCNGGLCQAGICTTPIDGGRTEDVGADPDVVHDPIDDSSDVGNDSPVQSDEGRDPSADVPTPNACGGTATLDGEPGDSCGDCDDGELACDGPDALSCEGASEVNVCGGCGPLPGIPGTPCGECGDGQWFCAGGDLECSCDVVEANGTCAAPYALELGAVEQFTLCGEGDEERQIAGPEDCRQTNSRGEDVVFTFELSEASTVDIDLRDDDDTIAIDTVVYVRSTCSDEETQIICSDDVLCEDSVFDPSLCTGPVQVRQSHIRAALEAGTYYLIADSFNYTQVTTYGCGTVRLSLGE